MSKFPVSFSLYITGTLLKGGEGGRIFPKLSHLGGRLWGVDVEIGGCFFFITLQVNHIYFVWGRKEGSLCYFSDLESFELAM